MEQMGDANPSVAGLTSSEESLDRVKAILRHAKLNPEDLRPEVQSLSFDENLDTDSFKLLQLDKELVEFLKKDQSSGRLVIRGFAEDEAILCTPDACYELKETETSNSLILVRDLRIPDSLPGSGENDLKQDFLRTEGSINKFYELRKCRPQLERLRSILEQNQYSGVQSENKETTRQLGYSVRELLERVQASEGEIKEALRSMNACELPADESIDKAQGRFVLLDFDYQADALTSVLKLCEESARVGELRGAKIPVGEILRELCPSLFPEFVVRHTLRAFGHVSRPDVPDRLRPSNGEENENAVAEAPLTVVELQADEKDEFVTFDEDRVCRFLAESLLRQASGHLFDYAEFLSAWRQMTGQFGFRADPAKHTRGLAVITQRTGAGSGGPNLSSRDVITYFPETALPDDLPSRFERLFEVKAKWTLDEIVPYLEQVLPHKATAGSLLIKHARAVTQEGTKYYCSRTRTPA